MGEVAGGVTPQDLGSLISTSKQYESLGITGVTFLMFILCLVVAYRLFKSKLNDCEQTRQTVLLKIDEIKEEVSRLKDLLYEIRASQGVR